MFIYSLYINHVLFMKFIFLGWVDCFVLSSLKSIAFFPNYFTTYSMSFPFLSSNVPSPWAAYCLSCAHQWCRCYKKKGGNCPRNNGRTRCVDVSQNSFWWAARLSGRRASVFALLGSVPLTTQVWCLHFPTAVPRNKESFVRAIHLAHCCQI